MTTTSSTKTTTPSTSTTTTPSKETPSSSASSKANVCSPAHLKPQHLKENQDGTFYHFRHQQQLQQHQQDHHHRQHQQQLSATTNGRGLQAVTPSNREVKKTSMNDEPQLDSWTNLSEGFSDLVPFLNPDDTKSEVDKVVCFILEQNIPVRYVNIKYQSFTLEQVCNRPKEKLEMKQNGIKFGRFSRGLLGEDEIIKLKWENLISEAKIKNPVKCIADFNSPIREENGLKFKKGLNSNILGSYLGQTLPDIRLSCDVFNRAVILFYLNNTGPFTKEEDTFILETVEQLGASKNTFKQIAQILRIPIYYHIKRRYDRISKYKECKEGFWTSSDFEIFFDYIFGKHSGPDYIQSVSPEVISKAAQLLNRVPYEVYATWQRSIKPTLLNHHTGNLHSDCRMEFFVYLVEKKVKTRQEIDWKEVQAKFPNHNSISFGSALTTIYYQKNFKCQPLFKTIQEYLPKLRKNSEKVVKYREEVVYFYDKARGV